MTLFMKRKKKACHISFEEMIGFEFLTMNQISQDFKYLSLILKSELSLNLKSDIYNIKFLS